ncbi:MAG: efflux RND transporter periplasmic adaptor subunit [Actinomycetes bacterium]|jgi:HlyD family secretion protein|nr:efflux RND transporter periplasmic adaptor subunit [Actinomycetes bacterium]
MATKSKKKLIIALIVIAVLIVAAVIAVFAFRGAGTTVEATEVKNGSLAVTVLASGSITSGENTDVYPETTGIVKHVAVEEGDVVHEGDVLLTLDDDATHAQLAQAKSGLAQAKSGLAQAEAAGATAAAGTSAANAALKAAKSGLTAAKDAYSSAKRIKKLAQDVLDGAQSAVAFYEANGGAAAKADPTGYASAKSSVLSAEVSLEQAKSGVASAKAGVASAESGVAQAKSAVKQAKSAKPSSAISAAKSGVKAAEEGVAVAQTAVDATTITAPADGTVIFAPTAAAAAAAAAGGTTTVGAELQKGSAVTPGSPVFTIVNEDKLAFTVEVDEADIPRIKVDQQVKISLDSFSGKEYAATVAKVGSVAKTTLTGGTVFNVEMSFDEPDEQMKIGMKGDATIEVETLENVLTVPIEALFSEGGKDYLYVINADGKLQKADIEVGSMTDTALQIVNGVQAGEKVALAGSTQLSAGMKVNTK